MQFFADTANIDELKELISLGIVEGCTTNPTICLKEKGCNFETQMKKIIDLVNGDVSIEVTSNKYEEMLKQARLFSSWGKNVVVKIPMNRDGLKAVFTLGKEGISTNVTACMATKQAILAAKAGAKYVSFFWARIEDMGHSAKDTVTSTVELFRFHEIPTKIIVGSLRQMSQINDALQTGADILTIVPELLYAMIDHPRTESTIAEFLDNWKKFTEK
nr:transaldolase family protein [Candidatus Sigynarchaeum springense]MDO8118498.1 transaldolase family protein [Candidatus Sigynarchaeota archaeon]